MASAYLTAVPAGQGDGERAFVASVVENALEHMTRAVEVIKDTQASGRKTDVLKGDAPDKVQESLDKVANAVQVNLNAYLAFVAAHGASGFPSEQHQRDRELTAEIFGSIDKAATFSGIGQLVSKLDELMREAQPRILWGNGFKAITALGDVSSNFSKAASSLDDATKGTLRCTTAHLQEVRGESLR